MSWLKYFIILVTKHSLGELIMISMIYKRWILLSQEWTELGATMFLGLFSRVVWLETVKSWGLAGGL